MKVSVAMTTFNGVTHLREQIDSILNQSTLPDEIIVSDDGSTDGTIDLLNEYQEKGLLQWFPNKEKGIVSNFRNAVDKCKIGNYIALADQDDIWDKEKISICSKKLVEIDKSDRPSIVYSDLTVVNAVNQIQSESYMRDVLKVDPSFNTLRSQLFSNKVIGCTVMMNRSMREHFEKMNSGVCMHDFWVALIAMTIGNISYIDSPLIRYRRHGLNASGFNGSLYSRFKKEILDIFFNRTIVLNTHFPTVELFLKNFEKDLNSQSRVDLQWFLELKKKSTFMKRVYTQFYKR